MTRQEEFLPKALWGDGPWQQEPDRLEFEHAGLPCILNRAPVTGAWCGYVGVPPGHKLYGIWYGGCIKGCKKEKPSYVTRKEIGRAKRQGDVAKVNMLVAMRNMNKSSFYKRMRKEHPRASCDYGMNHSPESILRVHGGITYSDYCHGVICHTPKPGEADNVYWFGFDCAHAWDLSPAMEARLRSYRSFVHASHPNDVYRDIEYAKTETKNLAEQLAALK